MLKYMLDTNICNFTIKNKPHEARDAFRYRCRHANIPVFRLPNAKKPQGSARRWIIASAYCQGLDV